MNILSGGLLPKIHSTSNVSQKNVASSKPCLLKNTGCSKKSSLKNLESWVGTLDFWTNVGHPAHLGCLCQFEPLWPKKSFQHSSQNSADNFLGHSVYDIFMKLCARAGLVYLEVNGGHFLGAMGWLWFSYFWPKSRFSPIMSYTTTSLEKQNSRV